MTKESKNVFSIANKYIVLATPLILFSLFSNIYVVFSASGRIVNFLITLILLVLMSGAFLAGWFLMVKKAVNDEYPDNPYLLMKDFIPGVGEYFLSVTGGVFCTTAFALLILVLAFVFGNNLIGDIGITSEQLTKAMESTEALKIFLSTLTIEQMVKIKQWNILILISLFMIHFLLIFYYPAMFYKKNNPFISLFIGIKDLFTERFFEVLTIVFLFAIVYLFLSAFSALTAKFALLHLLATMLNFYFIIIFVVWSFNFYSRNIVHSYLGKNIDKTI